MTLCLLSTLTWRQVSHWQTTISLYEHTLKNTSNNWIMHNNLGRELMQNGQYKKATNHFKQALLTNPESVAALANLPMVRTHQGNLQSATKLLIQALDLNPNYTYGQNSLVLTLALLRKKAPDQYQLILERIRLDSRYREVYIKLGKTFLELGDTSEACRIFKTIILDNPKNRREIEELQQHCNGQYNNKDVHSLETTE